MTPPAIILSQPQMGENVGAAARAMKNFGLSDLRLIAPKMEWPNDRAQILASGAGDILERAQIHANAAAALADCQLVLATTARGRDVAREVLTPEAAVRRLRQASGAGQKTALLSVENPASSTSLGAKMVQTPALAVSVGNETTISRPGGGTGAPKVKSDPYRIFVPSGEEMPVAPIGAGKGQGINCW